jgi:hypothetical protein
MLEHCGGRCWRIISSLQADNCIEANLNALGRTTGIVIPPNERCVDTFGKLRGYDSIHVASNNVLAVSNASNWSQRSCAGLTPASRFSDPNADVPSLDLGALCQLLWTSIEDDAALV